MNEPNVSNDSGFRWHDMHNRGFSSSIKLVAVVLSIFLLVLTIKELKSYNLVGAGVPAVNTINVSGKGEAFALPDIATFSFTIMDESLVVKTAQDAVTKNMNDILAYFKKAGVDDKDITTTSYDIYPRYEYYNQSSYPNYNGGKQVLAGYDVSETVSVKVRKIADAGGMLTALGELGATNISGLAFTVDKEDTVTALARTKAIQDAQSKAQELAKELGVRLVRIVNYSESGNMPMYYGMATGVAMKSDASAAPVPVATGQNKFMSNISITYEIQ